jgi:signal transduction histidine kinase
MHELLDRIPGSFTKMLTFIDTLLNYAMAGKIIGETQTVSLGKILQTVIEQFEQERQQGIVKFKLPAKWPTVKCDVLKMSQVWQNLIGNSIKYRGELDQVEIKIGTRVSGNWCESWIEDNGSGIPSAEGERIFKPFIRLDDSNQGSGIGLATVARILEAHKGIIRLDSRYCDGARFYMRWPHHSSNE